MIIIVSFQYVFYKMVNDTVDCPIRITDELYSLACVAFPISLQGTNPSRDHHGNPIEDTP